MAETKEKECVQNPVGWFEIYVQDVGRAKKFYETVFDFKLQKMDAGGMEYWGFPMTQNGAGAAGALTTMPGLKSGGNSTIVYFSCEDCAVEESRVKTAGGAVFKSKFAIGPYGHIALVTDPDGNMIGLHSRG